MQKECEVCQKTFEAREADHKRGRARFCSLSCSSSRSNPNKQRQTKVICAYCQCEFLKPNNKLKGSKSGLYFCSREHKDKAQRIGGIEAIQPDHYKNGKHTHYRKLALREFPKHCNRCQWREHEEVLVAHHKNRDRTNNTLENLEILCPTCHAVEHFLAGDGPWTSH